MNICLSVTLPYWRTLFTRGGGWRTSKYRALDWSLRYRAGDLFLISFDAYFKGDHAPIFQLELAVLGLIVELEWYDVRHAIGGDAS